MEVGPDAGCISRRTNEVTDGVKAQLSAGT